jgi:aryl-phospho-beta-D-glucosidase BglC (GH1 family)
MAVQWSNDVDQALTAAKDQKLPVLIDFSAAPA